MSFEEGSACVEIQDNGRGIPEKYQPQIFEMFFRAAHDRPGSGLGLYIVQETIEKLQGRISLESQVGEGTTFTVCIPNLAD